MNNINTLKQTPLFEKHQALGAKFAPFGGWNMPIQYEGILKEHQWTRSSCSIFDICHMAEFIITGNPTDTGFDNIITQDIRNAKNNTCCYGFMLNEKSGIIDDIIVYKISDGEYMLVSNAATINKDETNLLSTIKDKNRIANISEITAKIDVQGPLSVDVLEDIVGSAIRELEYYTFSYFEVLGEKIIISRTGYTGEIGFEIYISPANSRKLWDILLKDDRVKPAGLGARDTLRLEMSYPLYGQDISDTTTPYEACLTKFVDKNKEFIGKENLNEIVSRKLRCFVTDSRRAPRHNYKIYDNDKQIGIVTSGSYSPSLGLGIGMGYIDMDHCEIGREISIKEDNVCLNAKIVGRTFYKEGTARTDIKK